MIENSVGPSEACFAIRWKLADKFIQSPFGVGDSFNPYPAFIQGYSNSTLFGVNEVRRYRHEDSPP